MKRTHKLLFTFTAFLLSLTSFSQENTVWGLDKCIEHAWENNLQLQQQKLSVDLAGENLLQSKANRFPTLNAGMSHNYNTGRTIDPFTNDFATKTVQSNNFNISSSLNVFSGFQIHNTVKQNELNLNASKLDLEKSYNDVALMIASAYLQILFNLEMVENANNQLEISRQQVERTQKLVEAGTLARGSLLTIQAQLAGEELQLVNAQNQLDISVLNLKQMLYLPPEDDFTIDVPEIEIAPEEELEGTPLQIYAVAIQEQPDVHSSKLRIQSAERGVDIARGGHSPSLFLRGSYGTGYSGNSTQLTDNIIGTETVQTPLGIVEMPIYERMVIPFADQLSDNVNRTIGLTLSIPIFNNYQVKTNVSRSRIQLENAILSDQIVRDQLFNNIQQAHADAKAALKRFYASQINVDALEEAFRYTEQRFSVGLVNTLEYNDAKNRLSQAESELLQSKYEYVFRSRVLDFYMGNPLSL